MQHLLVNLQSNEILPGKGSKLPVQLRRQQDDGDNTDLSQNFLSPPVRADCPQTPRISSWTRGSDHYLQRYFFFIARRKVSKKYIINIAF
jgi:hypothetical protein